MGRSISVHCLSLGTQQPVEADEVQAMESIRPEGGGPALAKWARARGTEGHEATPCRDGAGRWRALSLASLSSCLVGNARMKNGRLGSPLFALEPFGAHLPGALTSTWPWSSALLYCCHSALVPGVLAAPHPHPCVLQFPYSKCWLWGEGGGEAPPGILWALSRYLLSHRIARVWAL